MNADGYANFTVAFVDDAGAVHGSAWVQLKPDRLADADFVDYVLADQATRRGPSAQVKTHPVLLTGHLSDAQACIEINRPAPALTPDQPRAEGEPRP